MWMLGELVVAPLRAAWWLVQRPVIALVLLAAGLVAAAVLGAF
jgi:hypothetical protein